MPSRSSDLSSLEHRFEVTDLFSKKACTYLYKAIEKSTGRRVLLKCLKSESFREIDLARLDNHYQIAHKLSSAFVVPVLDFYQTDDMHVLVLEDLGGGSLHQFVEQRLEKTSGSLGVRKQYVPAFYLALKIAQAIAYFEKNSITHGNLNPESVWINQSATSLRIDDFSYAQKSTKFEYINWSDERIAHHSPFIAPEVDFSRESSITIQSDFYSLGSILQYLISTKRNDRMLFSKDTQAPDGFPSNFSNDVDLSAPGALLLKSLIQKLKHANPNNRYANCSSLIKDLNYCIAWLDADNESSDSFQSKHSKALAFNVCQDIFGRDHEFLRLNQIYETVNASKLNVDSFRVVKVVGSAGIGKTVLAKKFALWARAQGSKVPQGRFAQYRKGEPLSAFLDVFNDLLLQVLSESKSQQAIWKEKLISRLQGQAGVLQELLPSIIELIGPQPEPAPISGEPAAQRLTTVLLNFLSVFVQPSCPLVIVLDDCQWADKSSIRLLNAICTATDNSQLVLLLVYRDDVSATIPLANQWLEKLADEKPFCFKIKLDMLQAADIGRIVAKTLGCSQAKAAPLSTLVEQRTGGDPFYVGQLLSLLHRKGHIIFAEIDNCWTCDLSAVKRESLNNSVDAFMSNRLLELSPPTLELLQAMACLGTAADLQTLSHCLGVERLPLARTVWDAMNSGLLVLQRDIYKFQISANDDETIDELTILYGEDLEYCLLHDRVRQAAYNLIPNSDRATWHARLGQRLLANFERESDDRSLFNILDKLGRGLAYIETNQERQAVAVLFQQAGIKARVYIAYDESLGYLESGIKALGENGYEIDGSGFVNLHLEAAASALMASKFNISFSLLKNVERYLASPLQILHHAMIQVQLCCLVNKLADALEVGYKSLEKYGYIHSTNQEHEVFPKVAKLTDLQSINKDADLSDQVALMLLLSMTPAAFYTTAKAYRELVSVQMKFCIDRGASANTLLAICNYGTLFLARGDHGQAFAVFDCAQGIEDRYPDPEVISHKNIFHNSFYGHWREPLFKIVEKSELIAQQCIDNGDYLFASYGAIFTIEKKLFCCESLSDFEQRTAAFAEFTGQVLHQVPNYQLSVWHQFVRNMIDGNVDVCELEGEAFSERKSITVLEDNNNEMVLFYLYFCKALLGLHFDQPVAASRNIRKAKETLQSCAATYCGTVLPIFEIVIEYCGGDHVTAASLHADHRSHSEHSDDHWELNFGHYDSLLLACESASLGQGEQALVHFERALEGALQRGMVHDSLLIKERLAHFCVEQGRVNQARELVEQCCTDYRRWGATAKVEHIRRLFSHIMQP